MGPAGDGTSSPRVPARGTILEVMTQAAPRHRYTYEDHLRFEASANVKHEYFAGEIYAMAGGTPEHAALAARVTILLGIALRGRRCRAYSSDLRVRVLETGLATYPDVSVVCGEIERDPEDRDGVTNPVLLVEVMSPSSEEYDRGDKLAHYRRIPALREIVLASHREHWIEVHSRVPDGDWTVRVVRDGEAVKLDSIGSELSVGEVYRDYLHPE
jgi:Uma2 family endonuclease